jgi:hypothetical protein
MNDDELRRYFAFLDDLLINGTGEGEPLGVMHIEAQSVPIEEDPEVLAQLKARIRELVTDPTWQPLGTRTPLP